MINTEYLTPEQLEIDLVNNKIDRVILNKLLTNYVHENENMDTLVNFFQNYIPGNRTMNEFIEKPINRDVLLFKIHEFFKLTRHNNVSECGDLNTSKSAVSNTYTKRVEEVEVLNHDVTNQLKIDVGDDIFIKVIDLFIKETDRRIVVIKQAALEDDIQQIEKEAHAIKSSASSVGAIALGDLARLLEVCFSSKR